MSWREHRREGESRHPDRWEPSHEEGRHRERRGSPNRRPRDRSPPWISERREYDRERDSEREKHKTRERDERDERRSDSRRRDDDRRRDRDRERDRERDRGREPRRHHDERSRGDSYDGKRSADYMQDSEPILREDEEDVGDWYCTCGFLNFKRRFTCYRNGCNLQRSDGFTDLNQEAAKEVSNGITRRLLFRKLDALTTEETVLQVLTASVPDIAKTVTGITIGRDSLTSASRGVCYVNFNTLPEATAAYAALTVLDPPLVIDNRSVLVSYCNENAPDRRVPSPVPTPPPPPSYSQTEFPQYFPTAVLSENDKVNAAAAVAQSAISQLQARASGTGRTTQGGTKSAYVAAAVKQPPNGDGLTKYSPPDVRTFLYDESSGYYYDSLTGLYYDSNTQYFFNNQISQYMYWDANNLTYVLAPQTAPNMQAKLPTPPEPTQQNTSETPSAGVPAQEEKKPKIEKQDRVKVAKKIAKDMERWARTLNQKKNSKNGVMAEPNNAQTKPVSGSADIGFTVLGQQQDRLTERALLAQSIVPAYTPPTAVAVDILPSKIIEQESFNAIRKFNSIEEEDEGIIDWSKLACLLCKRQFPSSDVITKHKNLSELHRTNLAEFRKLKGITDDSANQNYRDRAAERRMKYGEDDTPVPRKTKKYSEKHLPAPVHAAEAVIDTVGGKMLQKMGWSQGRGLGKEEQGRTAPIEAGQRPTGAGLGVATAEPGETYKNKVKRLMMARFQDMTE